MPPPTHSFGSPFCLLTLLLYSFFCLVSCCVNILQVGGLGDVVTSLSRAVQDLNHNVNIIFPKYDCMNLSNVSINFVSLVQISSFFFPVCVCVYRCYVSPLSKSINSIVLCFSTIHEATWPTFNL